MNKAPQTTAKPGPSVTETVLDFDDDGAGGGDAAEELPGDHLLRLALVKLLSKEGKSKKKTLPGLPLTHGGQCGSDSEEAEEGDDPLRRLSGAKGSMLLEEDPDSYIQAMQLNAAQILGDTTASPSTVERYVRE